MSHLDRSGHAASHHAPEPLPLTPLPPHSKAPSMVRPIAIAPAMPATHAHRVGGHATHPKGHFHPLPVIGHPEAFYVKHIQQAEAIGDQHARASHKVGQHVTSALDPKLSWDQKLKRFEHCLHRYCVVPTDADEGVRSFYHKLADLVRRHAGQEALHLGRIRHGEYQRRQRSGESREVIENDAETFFPSLLGHGGRPDWCSIEAWAQLTSLRDHWV